MSSELDKLLAAGVMPAKDALSEDEFQRLLHRYRGLLKQRERDRAFWTATNDNLRLAYDRLGTQEQVLRVAHDDLQTAHRELDAFTRTVAHDLKHPLGTIAGYTRYLLDAEGDLDPAERIEVLGKIATLGEQSAATVEELLLLASVRKGTVQPIPLAMGELVDLALARLAGLIAASDATILRPERWPTALGHPPWIVEIWANYLSNALKYGGRPPRIELGANRDPDSRLRFWVRDNGEGLAESQQAEIFAEFTRLDESSAEGHGLGLAIVRRIADRLDAEVGLTSTVGVGSVFFLVLPAAPEEACGGLSAAATAGPGSDKEEAEPAPEEVGRGAPP